MFEKLKAFSFVLAADMQELTCSSRTAARKDCP